MQTKPIAAFEKNALKYFTHLEGIEKLPNIKICKNINNFDKYLHNMIKSHVKNIPSSRIRLNIDKKREFFLSGNEGTYTERLINDVNKFSNVF